MNAMRAALMLAVLLLPASLHAQEVRSALSPDTATVGDVVRIAVRVDLPPGWSATLPDSLPLDADLEHAAPRRDTTEGIPGGAERTTFIYSVTPWRPGAAPLPTVTVTLQGPAGASPPVQAALPALFVRSVLPADTTGIQPKPARSVVGANWLWWPFVLAALLLLAIIGALYYWWRRRRARVVPVPLVPPLSPREAALAELERARALELVEPGELKRFYIIVSEALRHYLAAVDAHWSPDLTTSELIPRLTTLLERAPIAELERLLRSADMVKFARVRPGAAEAADELQRARRWVETYPPAPPAETQEHAA